MMHTRTAFTGHWESELWRIHLDEMKIILCNEDYEKGVGKV